MPLRVGDSLQFGGVDSRSNALNMPRERSVRCRNFAVEPSGALRLRYGYTQPAMTPTGAPITSAAYYELWAGGQFVMFNKGAQWWTYNIGTGVSTELFALANANPWGHFRANNRFFLSNGTDFRSYDGSTTRPVGIRAPFSTEVSSVVASFTTATAGSFSTTTLGGYDWYVSYYNPNNGHVGNRLQIAGPQTISGVNGSILLTGLPNLAAYSSEWVKLIGRTPDGGQVPYAVTDTNGNWIVVGNTVATATITSISVDYNSELPTRNDVPPPGFIGFAKCLDRVYAVNGIDPYLYYTESEADAVSGNFVGRWEESWSGDDIEAFPTAEVTVGVHTDGFEVWVFTKNNLGIYSEFLQEQVANPWRGPWPVGLANQRAFVQTPYGPFWIAQDKQLITWDGTAPIPADGESHKAMLARIGNTQLASIELAYLRDSDKDVDCIAIKALDSGGNTLYFVFDFLLRDANSPLGQMRDCTYGGITPTTFVGAGSTPWTPVLDTNKKPRLWVGDSGGRFDQLEDGMNDNGATFTADYIGVMSVGNNQPRLPEVGWIGDTLTTMQFSTRMDFALNAWKTPPTEVLKEEKSGFRCAAKVSDQGQLLYYRFLLTSHDGGVLNYTLNDPPHIQLETYGRIWDARLKLGAERSEMR